MEQDPGMLDRQFYEDTPAVSSALRERSDRFADQSQDEQELGELWQL